MALYKEILGNNGVTTSYHRVNNVVLDHDRTLGCILESYVSNDYAKNDFNCVEACCLTFKGVTLEEEESVGIRKLVYKKIKELEDWSDASDC